MVKTRHLTKKEQPALFLNCGKAKYNGSVQCAAKCVNCSGLHAASVKGCDHCVESEVLALQTKDKLAFKEAREWVLSRDVCQCMSYASLIKSVRSDDTFSALWHHLRMFLALPQALISPGAASILKLGRFTLTNFRANPTPLLCCFAFSEVAWGLWVPGLSGPSPQGAQFDHYQFCRLPSGWSAAPGPNFFRVKA